MNRGFDSEVSIVPSGRLAELIEEGEWDYLKPKPCKIMATEFALRDRQGVVRWLEMPTGQCIQGLHASQWYEPKVYLVNVPANDNQWHIAERWVRAVARI